MPKCSVILEETDNEYLLFIHASDRERAKRIEGRVWNPGRRCWVYPRTPSVYRSIVAEFGDNFEDRTHAHTIAQGIAGDDGAVSNRQESEVQTDIAAANRIEHGRYVLETPRVDQQRAEVERLATANADFERRLTRARQEYVRLTRRVAELEAQNCELQGQLAEQEASPDLSELLRQLAEKDKQQTAMRHMFEEEKTKAGELAADLNQARQKHAKLQQTIDNMAPNADAKSFLIRLALHASGGNGRFAQIMAGQDFNAQLPLRLSNELVVAVARLLRDGGTSESLHHLLADARREEALNEDQLDLAHIIRRQRNVVAHENLSTGSTTARVLLTLFAAALLWPDLQPRA